MSASVEVQGLAQLQLKLKGVSSALRKRVLLRGLRQGAKEVLKTARSAAPVLPLGKALHTPYRTPGTLRKAIRVRLSKSAKRDGDVGVFVNVKPLRGGSAKNPKDPYYWRWQEFGWRVPRGARKGTTIRGSALRRLRRAAGQKIPGRGFMQAGAKRLPQALQAFERYVADWLRKTNQTGKIQP